MKVDVMRDRRPERRFSMTWNQSFLRQFVYIILGLLSPLVLIAAEPAVSGNSTIRAMARNSEIVITTTSRLAGAIHSLTWNGYEFIDSADHGRQLQSASNFDAGLPLTAETFNPTEAGSRMDGAGRTSYRPQIRWHSGWIPRKIPTEIGPKTQLEFQTIC